MTGQLEYHKRVRSSISASLILVGTVLLTGLFTVSSVAQINGAPASVTSPGFGGRAVNGPPSSVTSLGPRGYSPRSQFSTSAPPRAPHNIDPQHRRRHLGETTPFLYAVPVPYAVDNGPAEDYADDGDNDPQYQGGPTVFDRRGSGARSYVPPAVANANSREDASVGIPEPSSDPDPTVLVFRDGRKLEVGNYAIVGATLFDLTPGHSRRIPLTELDLDVTRKQNEDRGVVFQLPPSLRAN